MFQTRLKQAREAAGYKSQQAFASALGTVQSTIGGWESGTREPNIEKMIQIANLLSVSLDYLLGRDATPSPRNDDSKNTNDIYKFLSTEYRHDIAEDFESANDADRLEILKTHGVPPSLANYLNARISVDANTSAHPVKFTSPTATRITEKLPRLTEKQLAKVEARIDTYLEDNESDVSKKPVYILETAAKGGGLRHTELTERDIAAALKSQRALDE